MKVITAQVPKEHCGHNSPLKKSPAHAPSSPSLGIVQQKSSISRNFDTARGEDNSSYEKYFEENDDVDKPMDQKDLFYYLMNKKYN